MRDLSHFQAELVRCADETEAALARLLVEDAASGATMPQAAESGRLLSAMRYSALGGGKRIRPFLVMATTAMFGGGAEDALNAGCALEFIHCYSLVHDDLPAMDDDDLRRGKPTVHKAYDDASAILAGDALLTLAFEVVAAPSALSASIQLALVRELAIASGHHGMVHGQMLDLAAEGRFVAASPAGWKPVAFDSDAISLLQRKKTGALIRCGVRMGGLIGGASTEELADLTAYAESLGLAFQIADDLIDAEGDADIAGKATAKDAEKGKATLVSLHGTDEAKAWLARTIADAEHHLQRFGGKAVLLADMAHFMGTRNA